jgi:hypothetical protein
VRIFVGEKKMSRKKGIPGLSFSWKRATGVTKAKRRFAKATGIPTSRSGRQRKIGRTMGCCLLSIIMIILLIFLTAFVAAAKTTPTKIIPSATYTPKIYSTETINSQGTVVVQCLIKGNISSKKEKIYHLPGQQYYEKTIIDESKGERWFCTEEEAIEAGWRKSLR